MLAAVLSDSPRQEKFKYSLQVKEHSVPEARSDQAVVQIQAAALNHRDIWILKGLYPGIKPESVLGADAVGVVLKSSGAGSAKVGQRVLISPSVNWDSNPRAPEGAFSILGLLPNPGTLAETINIDEKEVFACPDHLTTAEAAALPLAGLTAYRATFTKGRVQKGDHVLVTGIGGGVALFALQFAVAAGANVYVTSSSPEKIRKAVELGAKGGVNYKDPNAGAELKKLLNGAKITTVVDGSGGQLFDQFVRVMDNGGVIVQYGQTASPKGVNFNMTAVLKNIDICGSTMGSRAEFKELLEFVNKHQIHPIVSDVYHGLTQQNVDDAFERLEQGGQFGKVVIEVQNTRQKL